jgi:hypothetical protein
MTFAKEFVREQRKRGNRALTDRNRQTHGWKATEITSGVQMPFRLLIPASELRPPVPGWSTTRPVWWLSEPPTNYAYEIRLYRVCEAFTIDSPDGCIGVLWQRPLVDGWVLVVLAKLGLFPAEEQQKLELVRQQARAVATKLPPSALKDGGLRIINQGSADDGSRHFIDMALELPSAPVLSSPQM